MKRLKTVFPLLSFLLLVGCSSQTPNSKVEDSSAKPVDSSVPDTALSISSTAQSQSSAQNSSSSAASNVNRIEADKDVHVDVNLAPTEKEYAFLLPEFGPTLFYVKKIENSIDYVELYYGNNRIIDSVEKNCLFVADINNDHYREIVCTAGQLLIVYDVHNNYEMLKKDLYTEETPYLNNAYTPVAYDLTIGPNNKISLLAWNDSRTDVYYDYAYFDYQSQFNFLGLYMQNMYDISEIGYDAIYKGEEEIHPVNDTYELQKGVRYTLKFHINRKEDADLSKVIEAYANTKETLPIGGVYAMINNDRLPTNPNLRCENTNHFGYYTLTMTIPDTASDEGFIRGGYVNMDFRFNYRIVE